MKTTLKQIRQIIRQCIREAYMERERPDVHDPDFQRLHDKPWTPQTRVGGKRKPVVQWSEEKPRSRKNDLDIVKEWAAATGCQLRENYTDAKGAVWDGLITFEVADGRNVVVAKFFVKGGEENLVLLRSGEKSSLEKNVDDLVHFRFDPDAFVRGDKFFVTYERLPIVEV